MKLKWFRIRLIERGGCRIQFGSVRDRQHRLCACYCYIANRSTWIGQATRYNAIAPCPRYGNKAIQHGCNVASSRGGGSINVLSGIIYTMSGCRIQGCRITLFQVFLPVQMSLAYHDHTIEQSRLQISTLCKHRCFVTLHNDNLHM